MSLYPPFPDGDDPDWPDTELDPPFGPELMDLLNAAFDWADNNGIPLITNLPTTRIRRLLDATKALQAKMAAGR